FQAEDGIRDFHVTGVQTCALPICGALRWFRHDSDTPSPHEVWHIEFRRGGVSGHVGTTAASEAASSGATAAAIRDEIDLLDRAQIGRASCRERAEMGRVSRTR